MRRTPRMTTRATPHSRQAHRPRDNARRPKGGRPLPRVTDPAQTLAQQATETRGGASMLTPSRATAP